MNPQTNTNTDTTQSDGQDEQKKKYLLLQIEKILGQLTSESSATLETVTNDIIEQNKINKQISPIKSESLSGKVEAAVNGEVNRVSRPGLILCSACDGELFII